MMAAMIGLAVPALVVRPREVPRRQEASTEIARLIEPPSYGRGTVGRKKHREKMEAKARISYLSKRKNRK